MVANGQRVMTSKASMKCHRRFVSMPRACASATLVCAYASLQCENLFRRQCWYRSSVPEANRSFRDVYPTVDFQFWVMYGSWSRCPYCGVMHYNDRYFSHQVYDDKATSRNFFKTVIALKNLVLQFGTTLKNSDLKSNTILVLLSEALRPQPRKP